MARAVHVVAGEAHTLALTDTGTVFAWGRGFFGRLGTGKDSDEAIPVLVPIPVQQEPTGKAEESPSQSKENDSARVVNIAVGAYHSLALTDTGEVWSWGYNIYGQLGRDNEKNSIPCLISGSNEGDNHENAMEKVVAVEAGGMMSFAINEDHKAWMWGRCPASTCSDEGTFSLDSVERPQPMPFPNGSEVRRIACGNEHILALIHEGGARAIYAWGSNSYGQLGLGDKTSRAFPERVNLALGSGGQMESRVEMCCGAFHSAILVTPLGEEGVESVCQEGRSSSCWTFGCGENGQLGHGTTETLVLPKLVEGLPKHEKVVGVACGLFHTAATTLSGGVWVWGMEMGFGLCPGIIGGETGDAMSPKEFIKPSMQVHCSGHGKLACGAAHTVIIGNNGETLWAWGRGKNGVLGNGLLNDILSPSQVVWPPPCMSSTPIVNHDFVTPTNELSKKEKEEEKENEKEKENENEKEEFYPFKNQLGKDQGKISEDVATKALREELDNVKRYASRLHSTLFGVNDDGWLELEKMVCTLDNRELGQLEQFYSKMRRRVKEVLLERKMEELFHNLKSKHI